MKNISNLVVTTYYPSQPEDVLPESLYFSKLQEAVQTILNASQQGDQFAPRDPKIHLLQNYPWAEGPDQRFPYPVIVFGEDEVHFDEATEVKFGGTQGVLLRFADGDTILTVRAQSRSMGIGSRLWREADGWSEPTLAGMWLPSNLNEEQAAFAQKMSLCPTAMTLAGAVRWS